MLGGPWPLPAPLGSATAPERDPASTSQAQERPSVSEVEECRGNARMPRRGRPDAVAVASSL